MLFQYFFPLQHWYQASHEEMEQNDINIRPMGTAVIYCCIIAFTFVFALYQLPISIRNLHRDHPKHVKARVLVCSVISCLVPLLVQYHLKRIPSFLPISKVLGVHPSCASPGIIVRAFLLIFSMFLGPVIESLTNIFAYSKSFGHALRILSYKTKHNFVDQPLLIFRALVVAPLCEEWLFRSCMLPMLVLSGFSERSSIAITCIIFGLAHSHHYFEHRKMGKSHASALFSVFIMLLYTGIFGSVASHVFLRTGSFYAIAIMHSFANYMGFPVATFSSKHSKLYPFRYLFWFSYLFGLVLFAWMLRTGIWLDALRSFPSPFTCALVD